MLQNLINRFIKTKLDDCTLEYYFILRIIFRHINSNEKNLSNFIKIEIEEKKFNINKLHNKLKVSKNKFSKMQINSSHSITKTYSKIKSIQIKDFRSFGHFNNEDKGVIFNFNKNKNILFAPNGGGKSSFCEALEYKLTGEVKESKRRGLTLSRYIKHHNQFKPEIELSYYEDFNIDENDKNKFKYAFIEKNRLNEFALLGSKDTGVDEKDILAILLDLEELDNFISKFVLPNSLKLEVYKSKSIEQKYDELESKLKNERESIVNNLEEIHKLNSQKKLLNIRRELKEYKERKKSLNQQIGELKTKTINFHKQEDLCNLFSQIAQNLSKYNILSNELNTKKEQQDFIKLYEAVNSLSKILENSEKCPACDTPLTNVTINPLEKAKIEIEKLSDVASLTEEKNNLKVTLEENFDNLKKFEILIKNNIIANKELKDFKFDFIDIENANKIECLERKLESFKTAEYSEYFNVVKNIWDDLSEASNTINEIKLELENIESKETVSYKEKEKIKLLAKEISNSKSKKDEYTKELDKFKNDLIQEQNYNNFIDNSIEAYKLFKTDIENFKLSIEEERLSNIEKDTLDYYNLINKHDDKSEYLTKINFIKNTTKYNIEIEINNENKDAFNILSEGHLRSLGLAIILSLIKKLRIPFIIFDDVVNAIDSEHRANIIEMLYSEKTLKDKQLIITTHDRLFWERFSQTTNDPDKLTSYVLKYTNYGTVHIEYNIDFRQKIVNSLNHFDIRQSLLFCRIWFETEVIQYCIDTKKEISGNFSNLEKGNLLKPSLEKIYRDIILKEFGENKNLKIIRDGLNWNIQNQEHHTFDENAYNVVHSKTSDEVKIIFDAINAFIFLLFQEREENRIKNNIINLFDQYENKRKLINKMEIPAKRIEEFKIEKDEIALKIIEEVNNLKLYRKQIDA